MKNIFKLAVVAMSLVSTLVGSEDDSVDKDVEAITQLEWHTAGSYNLSNSHSTLSLPEDRAVVFGQDAQKFSNLNGNLDDSSLEAIVLDDSGSVVYFTSHNDGYVSLDDWDAIDSKELLENVSKNTELDNTHRRKNGMPELHVIGWIQEPSLNRQTNTVYWAIEVEDKTGRLVNSIALRLGRKGYEKLNWVTDKSSYVPFGGELDVMLRAHSFDPGFKYSDFVKGDNVATYGIAGLIAATLGTKILKATGLILLFKKFGIYIIAGLSTLFYRIRHKIKNLFRSKNLDS